MLVSVGEFGWLSDHLFISGTRIKRRGEGGGISPSVHSALPVLRDAHVSHVLGCLWQQDQGVSSCSGHGQMWRWICFPRCQLPIPSDSCIQPGAGALGTQGSLYAGELDWPVGSLWGKMKGNYLDTEGFLQMYLLFVRTFPWLCFWVQSSEKFSG